MPASQSPSSDFCTIGKFFFLLATESECFPSHWEVLSSFFDLNFSHFRGSGLVFSRNFPFRFLCRASLWQRLRKKKKKALYKWHWIALKWIDLTLHQMKSAEVDFIQITCSTFIASSFRNSTNGKNKQNEKAWIKLRLQSKACLQYHTRFREPYSFCIPCLPLITDNMNKISLDFK